MRVWQCTFCCFHHHRIEMICIRKIKSIFLFRFPLCFRKITQQALEQPNCIITILRFFTEFIIFQIWQDLCDCYSIIVHKNSVELAEYHIIHKLNILLAHSIMRNRFNDISFYDRRILFRYMIINVLNTNLWRYNALIQPSFKIQLNKQISSHFCFILFKGFITYSTEIILHIRKIRIVNDLIIIIQKIFTIQI